jgi:midasin (ATPase involved in ribosome maturation)
MGISRKTTDEIWRANLQDAWTAIHMIRDAIEELFSPIANLESEDAVLLRGPEPHHAAEAIIAALQRVKAAQGLYRGYEIHPDMAGYGFLAHQPNYDGEACLHGWTAEEIRREIDGWHEAQ